MVSPRYPVSNIGILFYMISNHAPVLCLRLPSTPHFYTVHDQASGSTSLLSFIQLWLCFLTPYFLGTASLTYSAPLQEGLTEQWLGPGHTQVCSWDHAAADAQRLQLGANPPQKKFA